MNKKQLKKVLDAISNKIKLSISEVSLTNGEIIGALSEDDYPIPISVKITGYNDNIYFRKLTIKNSDDEIIYSVDGTINSFMVYLSKQEMNNPIVIDFFNCDIDYITEITMNDIVFEGESGHEDIYTVNKVYDTYRINCKQCTININNLTGDIIIGTYPLPPS